MVLHTDAGFALVGRQLFSDDFGRQTHIYFSHFQYIFFKAVRKDHSRGGMHGLCVNYPETLNPVGQKIIQGWKKEGSINSWIIISLELELLELSWNQNENGYKVVRPEK